MAFKSYIGLKLEVGIMTKGRLEAFSDGVIAIIITITILEIGLPEGDDMHALIAILPIAACYLISFIMVGTNWANHHHLLQVAGTVDGKILWSNLLYLFVLSFQPVATGWVGKSGFAMLPVRVFCLLNLAGSLSYILLQKLIISAHDCEILRSAVSESRKEAWTICIEVLALTLSFFHGVHYLSCPLLVVAVMPWIIPDLRMKRVFEEPQCRE
jgi:uncharacterized membrane protein